jgi:hypothetical protein
MVGMAQDEVDAMNAGEETCQYCRRSISRQEQAYVVDGKVACEQCDKRLRMSSPPASEQTVPEEPFSVSERKHVAKRGMVPPGPFVAEQTAVGTDPSRREEGTSLVCRRCGQANRPGTTRCTRCRASLRPALLAVATDLGVVLLLLCSLSSLVADDETPILRVGTFVIGMAELTIVAYLRFGRLWAWVAVQVLLGSNVAVSLLAIMAVAIMTVVKTRDVYVSHDDAIRLIYVVVYCSAFGLSSFLFWVYLYTDQARMFCSYRRNLSPRVPHAEARQA